jgi:hypothetical protein
MQGIPKAVHTREFRAETVLLVEVRVGGRSVSQETVDTEGESWQMGAGSAGQ